jgi:hypothetical protein
MRNLGGVIVRASDYKYADESSARKRDGGLGAANREYADQVEQRQQHEEEALRTSLQRQVEEEERRQEILRSVHI